MTRKLSHKIFHSKILLFGEHIINKGAMGLAAPLHNYDGLFRFGDLNDKKVNASNKSLELFANYIVYHESLSAFYDTSQMLDDIHKGLWFDSNIPVGFGLGSSGALAAAVYYHYRKTKKKLLVINELKNELALLESYFHGKSSGLDAVVCYLNEGVIIDRGEVKKTFQWENTGSGEMQVFLINTHIERKTSVFVESFLKKCENKTFMNLVQMSLVPSTNIAIENFLQKKYSSLKSALQIISQLQLDLLPEFIPQQFHEVWKTGLRLNSYHLKICGAGGGGFIIGFTYKNTDLNILLKGFDYMPLINF